MRCFSAGGSDGRWAAGDKQEGWGMVPGSALVPSGGRHSGMVVKRGSRFPVTKEENTIFLRFLPKEENHGELVMRAAFCTSGARLFVGEAVWRQGRRKRKRSQAFPRAGSDGKTAGVLPPLVPFYSNGSGPGQGAGFERRQGRHDVAKRIRTGPLRRGHNGRSTKNR